MWFTAMNEFKDQLDVAEKEKVTKHVTELREIAAKGQSGDGGVTADAIREKINETQQSSLSLFQKVGNYFLVVVYHPDNCFAQVYEKKNAESAASESSSPEEEKKEEKKD